MTQARNVLAVAETFTTPAQPQTVPLTKPQPSGRLGPSQLRVLLAVCGRLKQQPMFECPGGDKGEPSRLNGRCWIWVETKPGTADLAAVDRRFGVYAERGHRQAYERCSCSSVPRASVVVVGSFAPRFGCGSVRPHRRLPSRRLLGDPNAG
jgi:hypothetical protein